MDVYVVHHSLIKFSRSPQPFHPNCIFSICLRRTSTWYKLCGAGIKPRASISDFQRTLCKWILYSSPFTRKLSLAITLFIFLFFLKIFDKILLPFSVSNLQHNCLFQIIRLWLNKFAKLKLSLTKMILSFEFWSVFTIQSNYRLFITEEKVCTVPLRTSVTFTETLNSVS